MPLKRKTALRRKETDGPSAKKQKNSDTGKEVKKTPAKTTGTRSSNFFGILAYFGKYRSLNLNLPNLPKNIIRCSQPTQTNAFVEPGNLYKQAKGMDPSGKSSFKDLLTDKLWKDLLGREFDEKYFHELEKKLEEDYRAGKKIFPPKELIFNAFNLTPLDKVKLVIVGQDPYHGDGQAMGLSFSVPEGIPVRPSLKNMYKELDRDPKVPDFKIPDHGCLVKWAEQGVLLLNATLTVEAHQRNSHSEYGWQKFTDNVIRAISGHCDNVVFLLCGNSAHEKEKQIDAKKHAVVKTAHPSPHPFNKFPESNCFSDCDEKLKEFGLPPIDWSLL